MKINRESLLSYYFLSFGETRQFRLKDMANNSEKREENELNLMGQFFTIGKKFSCNRVGSIEMHTRTLAFAT